MIIIILRVRGVDMDTKFGPAYACLFMGYVEQQFLQVYNRPVPDLFVRNIDDYFGTTSSCRENLNASLSTLITSTLPSSSLGIWLQRHSSLSGFIPVNSAWSPCHIYILQSHRCPQLPPSFIKPPSKMQRVYSLLTTSAFMPSLQFGWWL